MAVLGVRFCARAFSSCGKRGPLFIAVRGPLTISASLVVEHRLQMRRLSNCGSRAQLLCSMWDPPRPGLKPVSPALVGRFSTTAPPGKPGTEVLNLGRHSCTSGFQSAFQWPALKYKSTAEVTGHLRKDPLQRGSVQSNDRQGRRQCRSRRNAVLKNLIRVFRMVGKSYYRTAAA